ncbi:hypothetical protein Y032_0069g366 [Ancylostoma ceylanicum]|uniref:G-protein coupled receptors family 1 profile domain-containing protein n=1 Tax=Ancylostoma ceylanicum TaxID=53326 RepID=A0A016TY70_9BILA|nr:hypothetical protein Y032_0069g366 [Ancylostoma ceylanicum]
MNGSVLQCFWNNHPPPMATSERFAVGVALLILTVISFILNAALGYLVWKSPVFDRLFRLYVVSLVTAALSYLLTNCSILIPTALFHVNFDDPYNTILTVFDVVGYLAQIFTTTLIAVDRFVLFYIIGVHHGVVYRRHPIVFCIPALPWTASILLTIHTNLIGCYVRTNPFTLTYTYECSECGLYEPILYYLNHALPIITFILYCAIYANILVTRQRLRTGENSRKRRDAVRLKLLVGSSGNDPFSVIIVDPRTGVATWSYKGSELQGAAVGIVEPLGVNGDHLVISIKDRPLIHAFAVHPRDRYHQKSVVSGVIAAFCTTKDGSLLFAAVGTQVYIWLLSSGELLTVIDAHYQAITRISLSADESTLFTASTDGALSCYLVSDIISQDRDRAVEPLRKWKAHTLAVRGLSVSSGSNPRVASCGLDHLALIHSVSLDEVLFKVSADRPLTACVLDPAESRLFLGSDTGNIAQINLYALDDRSEILIQVADEKNERVPVFNGHCDEITALSVNGDGCLLASGDSAGKYCIWEIASRQCLKVSSMRSTISSLRFVPNWPSLSASEHVSVHPVFDLQRNVCRGEKIWIRHHDGKDYNKDFWHDQLDHLLESALQESEAAGPNSNKKKKSLKKRKKSIRPSEGDESDVVVLDDDILEISEGSSTVRNGTTSKEDKELIEKQREEIQKLKRINAELYSFMAKELTDR